MVRRRKDRQRLLMSDELGETLEANSTEEQNGTRVYEPEKAGNEIEDFMNMVTEAEHQIGVDSNTSKSKESKSRGSILLFLLFVVIIIISICISIFVLVRGGV